MGVGSQQIVVKSSVIIYLTTFLAGVAVASVLGVLLLRLPWYAAIGASAITGFFGEDAAGLALFTRVELSLNRVVLISPFKGLELARSDILSANRWLRSPSESEYPFWKQAAVLHLLTTDGRRISVGMLAVDLLR